MAKEMEATGLLHNVIAQGTQIVGTIETQSDIRIDGTLDGNIKCQGRIVVGQQGSVKGEMECVNSDVQGQVDGKIRVSDTLSIKATASIKGEIHTKVLSIEPQATFNGTCEMTGRGE